MGRAKKNWEGPRRIKKGQEELGSTKKNGKDQEELGRTKKNWEGPIKIGKGQEEPCDVHSLPQFSIDFAILQQHKYYVKVV